MTIRPRRPSCRRSSAPSHFQGFDSNMESITSTGAEPVCAAALHLRGARAPFTAFVVGTALERNPEAGEAMLAAGHEFASHGYRWIDYQHVPEEVEREHIRLAAAAHQRILGERPLGFYQAGRDPTAGASVWRRLRVRRRLLRRRSPLLDRGGGPTSSSPTPWMPTTCGCHRAGLQLRNAVRDLPADTFDVLYRGSHPAEDDVGGPALPSLGPAWSRRRPRALPRSSRPIPTSGSVAASRSPGTGRSTLRPGALGRVSPAPGTLEETAGGGRRRPAVPGWARTTAAAGPPPPAHPPGPRAG